MVRLTLVSMAGLNPSLVFTMNTIWYDQPEDDPFYVALGVAIQKRRLLLGLTQEQLAKLAGISRSWVQLVEGGKRHVTLEMLRRCCHALNSIWLTELLAEVERRHYQAQPDMLTLVA